MAQDSRFYIGNLFQRNQDPRPSWLSVEWGGYQKQLRNHWRADKKRWRAIVYRDAWLSLFTKEKDGEHKYNAAALFNPAQWLYFIFAIGHGLCDRLSLVLSKHNGLFVKTVNTLCRLLAEILRTPILLLESGLDVVCHPIDYFIRPFQTVYDAEMHRHKSPIIGEYDALRSILLIFCQVVKIVATLFAVSAILYPYLPAVGVLGFATHFTFPLQFFSHALAPFISIDVSYALVSVLFLGTIATLLSNLVQRLYPQQVGPQWYDILSHQKPNQPLQVQFPDRETGDPFTHTLQATAWNSSQRSRRESNLEVRGTERTTKQVHRVS